MTRPPFDFGYPEITLGLADFYLGDPEAPGAPGYYLGETLADAALYSRYSNSISTLVPIDSLSPDPYKLANSRLLITQNFNIVPAGRNLVTLEFEIPPYNEKANEYLMAKGGSGSGTQMADASFDPIAPGQYTVYAGGSSLGVPGGTSTIPIAPNFGARVVTVVNPVNFGIGQWVKIRNPVDGNIAIVKIKSISGFIITFETDIFLIMENDATIETINDPVAITEVTDYTILLTSGLVTVNDTAATQNKLIWIEYKATLLDYDGGDFWVIPGILPVPDYSDPILVSSFIGAVQVGSVNSAATFFSFEEDGSELGRHYTLYAIAKDNQVPANPSLARSIGFTQIPARAFPIVDSDDSSVEITWPDTRIDGSAVTAYNVIRCPGQVFVGSISDKVNENPILPTNPSVVFTDADGSPNRRDISEIPAPVNGNYYSYTVEAFTETGQYSILTQNERITQTEELVAEKPLFD